MADNLFDKCFCHFNGYKVKDADARRDIAQIMPAMEQLNDNLNELTAKVNDDISAQISELDTKVNNDIATQINNLRDEIIGALGGDY